MDNETSFFEVGAQVIPLLWLASVFELKFFHPRPGWAGRRKALQFFVFAVITGLMAWGEVMAFQALSTGPTEGQHDAAGGALILGAYVLVAPPLGFLADSIGGRGGVVSFHAVNLVLGLLVVVGYAVVTFGD